MHKQDNGITEYKKNETRFTPAATADLPEPADFFGADATGAALYELSVRPRTAADLYALFINALEIAGRLAPDSEIFREGLEDLTFSLKAGAGELAAVKDKIIEKERFDRLRRAIISTVITARAIKNDIKQANELRTVAAGIIKFTKDTVMPEVPVKEDAGFMRLIEESNKEAERKMIEQSRRDMTMKTTKKILNLERLFNVAAGYTDLCLDAAEKTAQDSPVYTAVNYAAGARSDLLDRAGRKSFDKNDVLRLMAKIITADRAAENGENAPADVLDSRAAELAADRGFRKLSSKINAEFLCAFLSKDGSKVIAGRFAETKTDEKERGAFRAL